MSTFFLKVVTPYSEAKTQKKTPSVNFLGFTLVELVVVVAALSLVFSIGYANYRKFQRRQMVESAARIIKADLLLTRGKAISGVKPTSTCPTLDSYNFQVDLADQQYQIVSVCTGGSPAAVKTVSVPSDIGADIAITIIPISKAGSPGIAFNVLGNGTNISSGSTVTVKVGLKSQLGGSGFCICTSCPGNCPQCCYANAEAVDVIVTSAGEIK